MFRIDNPTAAAALPAPTAAGAPGYFAHGDLAGGVPYTVLDPDWANMVQEEMLAIVAAGALAPSKNTYTQVRDAIVALISAATAAINANIAALTAALNALLGRTILGGGLVTGGGDLSASRTLTVAKASAADVQAGTADDRAITPLGLWAFPAVYGATGHVQIPGTKLVVQWFPANHTANASDTFPLPVAFATACVFAASDAGFTDTDQKDNAPYPTAKTAGAVTFFNAISSNVSGTVLAIGY